MDVQRAADFVVLYIVLTLIAIGLLSMAYGRLIDWLEARALRHEARVMSRADEDAATPEAPALRAETPAEATGETPETRVATGETERNALLRGKAQALAALIADGKVSETDGLRIVFGVAPGSSARYREAREALKQAQAERNPFPTLTADGRPVAQALKAS